MFIRLAFRKCFLSYRQHCSSWLRPSERKEQHPPRRNLMLRQYHRYGNQGARKASYAEVRPLVKSPSREKTLEKFEYLGHSTNNFFQKTLKNREKIISFLSCRNFPNYSTVSSLTNHWMVCGIYLRLFFKGGIEVRQGHLIGVVLIPWGLVSLKFLRVSLTKVETKFYAFRCVSIGWCHLVGEDNLPAFQLIDFLLCCHIALDIDSCCLYLTLLSLL